MNILEPLKKIQGLWPRWGRTSRPIGASAAVSQTGLNPIGQDDYELIADGELDYDAFDRLVRLVLRELRQLDEGKVQHPRSRDWFYERGYLPDKRRYFYLQSWNDEGWLFEEAGSGWTIARAVKIVHEQRFLRSRESWEAASLLKQRQAGGLLRVYSHRYGEEPLCLPIYEDLFLEELRRILRRARLSGG